MNIVAVSRAMRSLLFGDGKAEQPRPKCALIIEDNSNDAEMLKHLLRVKGWNYRWARSPREARDMTMEKMDIIFLDVAFPGDMDGQDYAIELSKSKRTENIPVVFLTGYADTILKSGSTGRYIALIPKPPELESICRALKSATGHNGFHNPNPYQPQQTSAIIAATWTLWFIAAAIGHGFGAGWFPKLISKMVDLLVAFINSQN